MIANQKLGNSQYLNYDGVVDQEIGARMRARLKNHTPKRTQVEIAKAIGMTPDAFSQALNGKRAFTAVELVKAAEALGTSAHWFVTGEPDPFAVKVAGRQTFDHALQSHRPLNWSAADDVISNLSLAYLQVYPASVERTEQRVPDSAARARQALRESVDGDFVRRLADATEAAFGVDVVRVGGFSDGLAMEVVNRIAIIVGETGNWFFENWSIAHELGHIAHDDFSEVGTPACDNPVAERAANAFAAELLLPVDLLTAQHWDVMDLAGLASFIWTSGVSTQALQTRLSALGINVSSIAQSGLRMNTQALLRRSGILSTEPADRITERMQQSSARRFPEHLVSAHADAVSDGKIGAGSLAWMLGVPADELDEQLAPIVDSNVDVDALAHELGLIDPAT